MLLSVPGSLYPGGSVAFITGDFVKTFALLIVVAASVRHEIDVRRFAYAMVVGALIHSGMSLFLGRPGDERLASASASYDPNDLALFVTCTLPFVGYWLSERKHAAAKWIAVGAGLVFLATVVKSGSRGGFIALVAFIGYWLATSERRLRGRRVALIALSSVLVVFAADDSYWERVSSIFNPTEDYNWVGGSDAGRMEVWKRGMGYMFDNPVLGVGVAGFGTAEGLSDVALAQARVGRGFKWSTAHSAFVLVGAELGMVGLAIYLMILISSFRALRKMRRTGSDQHRALAHALEASFFTFVVGSIFLSVSYSTYLYFTLAAVIGLARVVRLRQPPFATVPAVNGHGLGRGISTIPLQQPMAGQVTHRVGR
jgi:O-antigen ligase